MVLSPTVQAVVAHEAGKSLSPEEQALFDAHLKKIGTSKRNPQQQAEDTATKAGEVLQQQG